MEAHSATASAPRAGIRLPGVGAGLGRGTVVLYLSAIVLLPLAAVVSQSLEKGVGGFWEAGTTPLAVGSVELTVICSLVVVLINGICGTIIAWILVPDEVPGNSLVNAAIGPPVALPTS